MTATINKAVTKKKEEIASNKLSSPTLAVLLFTRLLLLFHFHSEVSRNDQTRGEFLHEQQEHLFHRTLNEY